MASRLPNGLTPKQQKLETVLLKQIKETGETNITQAGLQAYDSKSPKAAYEIAKEALDNTGIKDRIDKAMVAAGLTPSSIMDNLKDLATREVDKVSADVKLKTNVELLKLLGAYPGTKHARLNINMKGTIKDMNHKEVKDELKVIDSELNNILDDTPTEPV